MKILVTGGAGFIGSHYVRTLLASGYPGFEDSRVTVLDKLAYAGDLANLEPVSDSPRFAFTRGDICDAALLTALLPGHDTVINFAAETHVDRSIAGAGAFVGTNVNGVQALLQACLEVGVQRVVQVSTDEVYGSVEHGSWTEDAPLAPNSPYAAAKAGGDLLARAYAHTHGLDVRITRCSRASIWATVTLETLVCSLIWVRVSGVPGSSRSRAARSLSSRSRLGVPGRRSIAVPHPVPWPQCRGPCISIRQRHYLIGKFPISFLGSAMSPLPPQRPPPGGKESQR